MDKEYFIILNQIKEHYYNGGNVIEYLKKHFNRDYNTFDDIKLSYDLQAGSYVKIANENKEYVDDYSYLIYTTIRELTKVETIFEAGVGEATTFGNVLKHFDRATVKGYGIDLSWSRVKYAQSYLYNLSLNKNTFVAAANIFHLPFADNSIDVVYTSHSIEPNGGKEKPLIEELMRVAKKYLVLLEPAYDLAGIDAKMRMEKHGYCINL